MTTCLCVTNLNREPRPRLSTDSTRHCRETTPAVGRGPVSALTSVALRAPSVSAETGYLICDAGNILRCATIHPKVTFSNCATGSLCVK